MRWLTTATAGYSYTDDQGDTDDQILVAFQSRRGWWGGVRRRIKVLHNTSLGGLRYWDQHYTLQSDIVEWVHHSWLPEYSTLVEREVASCRIVTIDGKEVA